MFLPFIFLIIVFIAFGMHGVYLVVNAIAHPVPIAIEVVLIVLAGFLAKHLMDNYFAKRDRTPKGSA